MKKLNAKSILKNIDWRVNINIDWKGEKIDPVLVLPKQYRELIESMIESYIDAGQVKTEEIYVGQVGTDLKGVKELQKAIITFEKKYKKIMRKHIDDRNQFPIQISAQEDYVILRCKVEYDKDQLITIAKGMVKQEIYKYKQEYLTMIRVTKTLEKHK